jgi:hypothetical protein
MLPKICFWWPPRAMDEAERKAQVLALMHRVCQLGRLLDEDLDPSDMAAVAEAKLVIAEGQVQAGNRRAAQSASASSDRRTKEGRAPVSATYASYR